MQVPPMYSALKVNGKKLYELARAGKEIERQARPVEILDIQIEKIDLPRVTFHVSCSKGTYIRTLCYDIGRKLGCGGCMESLLRTRVDRFCLEDSLTLSQIEALRDEGRVEEHVLPVDSVFLDYPKFCMKRGEGDKLVHNGNPFRDAEELFTVESSNGRNTAVLEKNEKGGCFTVRVYDSEDQFIGLYQYEEEKQRYRPQKIFLGGK